MNVKEIWNWLLGLFWLAPWWLKILIVLMMIGMFCSIIEKIVEIIRMAVEKTKITAQINSNPKLALQTLESSSISPNQYENHLIKIAENTGDVDAMIKLTELYSGQKYKWKSDDKKYKLWNERAAKAGGVESIKDYYGFSDYDVSSGAYQEMIRDLDASRAAGSSEDKKALASYLKGIVCYKMGNINAAKQLFLSVSIPELADKSKYMLFQCYVKETNINEAEKILEQMEAVKFEIPAADYLSLYHYYAAKGEAAEPNYPAEMKYVDKYTLCKDADRKTADKIGATTYYHAAIALQNGNSGFEQDMEKAQEAYEKAADCGNVEALFYLGESYWNGNGIRNYHKANEFLLQASQRGHKQARKILTQYGVDDILVKPMRAENKTYYFLDGYELTASVHTIQWLQLYYGIQYKQTLIAEKFSNAYAKRFASFDQMINGIHLLYTEYVAMMLRWSLPLFMFFGIDQYSVADIMDGCEDLSLLPRVPGFERGLDRIDDRAAQLHIQTAYAKATRGQWCGTGFGTTIGGAINATVKASVAAEIMNIGSGILHGIGDSIVQAIDNSEIKGMGKQLFENPNTGREFCSAVITACVDIGGVVMEMIERHCNMKLEGLEGKIVFGTENLAEIDDRALNAKIINNMTVQKWDYAHALAVEKLRRNPLDADAFQQVVALTIRRDRSFAGKEYESILQYASDFGLVTQLKAALDQITAGA